MVFIYALELNSKKYYIGKTTNPCFRFEQHFKSEGSSWTMKYKPIKLYELIPDCDDYDTPAETGISPCSRTSTCEDKYTIKYMDKYGIDNVRGGSFCKLELNENELIMIKKMIESSTNKCYKCGEKGHFAKNCNEICTENSENILLEEPININSYNCQYCNKEFTSKRGYTHLIVYYFVLNQYIV